MADNRRIAAIAAALSYIEAENASAAEVGTLQRGAPQRVRAGGGSAADPWALYGRQRIMAMRALMQRRALTRRV